MPKKGWTIRRCGAIGTLTVLATVCGSAPAPAHEGHRHAMTTVEDPPAVASVSVPDVEVVTQDGKKALFRRDLVAGRPVVVDFIYTTCTAICSPMTANLREVQKLLGADAAKVTFISITVDPKTDTPRVLKDFAARFGIDDRNWIFVTAKPTALAKLQKGFAVSMARKQDHTPLVIVGNDATGRWVRKFGMARPEVIAAAVRDVAGLAEPAP